MIRSVACALLVLLLTVGQASAECAWVLWREVSFCCSAPYTPAQWDVEGGTVSQTACEQLRGAAVRKTVDDLRLSTSHEVKVNTTAVGETVEEKMGSLNYIWTRFLCTPNTVDPRGAKGK
jgi:hypothetical protein